MKKYGYTFNMNTITHDDIERMDSLKDDFHVILDYEIHIYHKQGTWEATLSYPEEYVQLISPYEDKEKGAFRRIFRKALLLRKELLETDIEDMQSRIFTIDTIIMFSRESRG